MMRIWNALNDWVDQTTPKVLMTAKNNLFSAILNIATISSISRDWDKIGMNNVYKGMNDNIFHKATNFIFSYNFIFSSITYYNESIKTVAFLTLLDKSNCKKKYNAYPSNPE